MSAQEADGTAALPVPPDEENVMIFTNHWHKALQNYFDAHWAGDYLRDEPLARHTWYRIGGPADFLAYPRDAADVVGLLRQCRALEVETYFIGAGANLLVSDAGFRGVMLLMGRYFTELTRAGNIITAAAGVLLKDLVLFAEREGLGGLEYLAGIPGTVGGALTMNAGIERGEIGDVVREVTLLNDELEPITLAADQITFGYRSAPQLQAKPLLGCQLQLRPADAAALRQIRLTQLAERAAKQPLDYPSCGSVFKRPPNHYVGKMVEASGLKGLRQGDAMISEKHGGFIINLGHATANDVRHLIVKIQEAVEARFGVRLVPEVRLAGF